MVDFYPKDKKLVLIVVEFEGDKFNKYHHLIQAMTNEGRKDFIHELGQHFCPLCGRLFATYGERCYCRDDD